MNLNRKTIAITVISFAWILFSTGLSATAQKRINVASPSKRLQFTLQNKSGVPEYQVLFDNKVLINYSTLNMQFDDGVFGKAVEWDKPVYLDTIETYQLPVGKASTVVTHYNSVVVTMHEKLAPKRTIKLHVKLFDDGLAFRYEFPRQEGMTKYTLLDENTRFNIAGNPVVKALVLPNYTTSHEGFYTTQPLQEIKEDTLMDMPALFQFPNKVYMAITEAALVDYAGMYLSRSGNGLISKLSPLPGQSAQKVKAVLPHQTPWRVIMVSDRAGALIESNLLTSLNEPSKIGDISWLKPGKITFPWWNGNVTPDTLNAPGNNFVTAKYYIDFCARNKIEYHSVVEYGLHQWYVDDGVNFMPGSNADVTKPVPGLDMKEICDYGKTKGVAVRVWVHWAALYPKLDTAFALFEKWGLTGMMVDFMDRDDQEMVNIQREILEKAAKHHLHIQFHGAYKPTGLHRTYPNELTREGALNYEHNKWNPAGVTPAHDLDIVFTRMLAGATDYHQGGFRAVKPEKFRAQYTRPIMLGTRCHQLGMYVVLENYLGMVADYPDAYEGEAGFDFIKEVPTVWDETKVIGGAPDEYVAVARRKGNDWYVGTITGKNKELVNLNLSFLSGGNYTATLYTDGKNIDTNPNSIQKQTRIVTKADVISLQIKEGSGAAIVISKQ